MESESATGVESDSEAVELGPEAEASVETDLEAVEPGPEAEAGVETDLEVIELKPESDEESGPERARYVCRKGSEERMYVLYRPGVSNKEHLCEIDLIIGGQENRRPADWRARNQADFCEKELEKIIDKHTNEEGYTCFEN